MRDLPVTAPRAPDRGRGSPSADLYFGFACDEFLADGRVIRLSPTVFRAGDAAVVVRHLSGARIPEDVARLFYVIDDDVSAGLRDPRLPPGYRAKLALVEAQAARRLIPRASRVLAASDALAERIGRGWPEADVIRIDPAWPAPPRVSWPEGPPVLAMLGARTHGADFRFLRPVLERVLDRREPVRLVLSGNLPVPGAWHRHARVTIVPATGWRAYREWLVRQHFDLGLYPLLDGGMNAGRSSNKLGEYAQAGAAIVASDTWPAGRAAAVEGRAVAVANARDAWAAAIDGLLADRSRAREIAEANRQALWHEDAQGRQRALWSDLLRLDGSGR